MSNVRFVRLTMGDQIFAQVSDNLDNVSVTLKNPMMFVQDGRGRVGLGEYLPFADTSNGITINKNLVAYMLPIDSKLESDYNSAISGVVIPTPGEVAAASGGLKLVT